MARRRSSVYIYDELVTLPIYEPTMVAGERGFRDGCQGAGMMMAQPPCGQDSCSRPCVDELYDEDFYELIINRVPVAWISLTD